MKIIVYRTEMRNYYNEVRAINNELLDGHNIRVKNHEEGIATMKEINAIIQWASRMRGKLKVH